MPLRIDRQPWLLAVLRLDTRRGYAQDRRRLRGYAITRPISKSPTSGHLSLASLKPSLKKGSKGDHISSETLAEFNEELQRTVKSLDQLKSLNQPERQTFVRREEGIKTFTFSSRRGVITKRDAESLGTKLSESAEDSSPTPNTKAGAILLLTATSKALTAADFWRILPTGKHLTEWKAQRSLEKVIVDRNPETLEPFDCWVLVFSSHTEAFKYKQLVIDYHKNAVHNTPSYNSPILYPAPGHKVDGIDIFARIQDYALYPTSQRVEARLLEPPYPRHLTLLLKNYDFWTQPTKHWIGSEELSHPVWPLKLSIEGAPIGFELTLPLLDSFIEWDEKQRHLPWNLRYDDTAPISPLTKLSAIRSRLSQGPASEATVSSQKWMLKFADEVDARRFIRTWHRRPFPTQEELFPVPTIHVEALW